MNQSGNLEGVLGCLRSCKICGKFAARKGVKEVLENKRIKFNTALKRLNTAKGNGLASSRKLRELGETTTKECHKGANLSEEGDESLLENSPI